MANCKPQVGGFDQGPKQKASEFIVLLISNQSETPQFFRDKTTHKYDGKAKEEYARK